MHYCYWESRVSIVPGGVSALATAFLSVLSPGPFGLDLFNHWTMVKGDKVYCGSLHLCYDERCGIHTKQQLPCKAYYTTF